MDQINAKIKPESKAIYWSAHFTKWELSDLSQERYCEQQKLSFASFGYWRTKLLAKQQPKSAPLFKPVVVKPSTTEQLIKKPSVSVVLANGVRVMLSVESSQLGVLFKSLSDLSC